MMPSSMNPQPHVANGMASFCKFLLRAVLACCIFGMAGCKIPAKVTLVPHLPINTSDEGGSAGVVVYVVFLKNDNAFREATKRGRKGDLLTPELRSLTAPNNLDRDWVQGWSISLAGDKSGEKGAVWKHGEFDEAPAFIGVVADFQNLDKGDKDWWLCEPFTSELTLHVSGKRLLTEPPAKPGGRPTEKPAATPKPAADDATGS